MRYHYLPPLLVIGACSGTSLKVGSDGSGGDDKGSGGTTVGGANSSGGSSARGGSAGDDTAGVSGVGAGGTLIDPTTGGSGGVAGASVGGASNGGASIGGSSLGGSSVAGSPSDPSITSCTDEFPYVGVWEGSVLDFYFEPIEELRLVVVANERLGGYEATLTFGTGEVPPLFGDPDEPFPSLEYWQNVTDIDGIASIEPWPGFGYSVVRGAGCDEVLRVSVSVAQLWDEWCQAQERVYTPGEGWGCTYQGGGSISSEGCSVQSGGMVLGTYPIWKCSACGAFSPGVCACTEDYCGFNTEPTHTFELELGTSGGVDVLSGSTSDCDDCTVRLERVE